MLFGLYCCVRTVANDGRLFFAIQLFLVYLSIERSGPIAHFVLHVFCCRVCICSSCSCLWCACPPSKRHRVTPATRFVPLYFLFCFVLCCCGCCGSSCSCFWCCGRGGVTHWRFDGECTKKVRIVLKAELVRRLFVVSCLGRTM